MIVFSIAVSWSLFYILIPLLRLRFVDLPNSRSSHVQPTPRGGGVVFVLLGSVSSGIEFFNGQAFTPSLVQLIAVPLAVVGLLDDRHNLPASCRYGVQLFTGVAILASSPLVQYEFGRGLTELPFLALLFLLIAFTAIVNFTNFMSLKNVF